MHIKRIRYSESKNTPSEWIIDDFTLGPINLIVGRNAVGKTRTIRAIAGLAKLLSVERKLVYLDGNYEVEFENDSKIIKYILEYHEKSIVKEVLDIDNKELLSRGQDGSGRIYFEKEDKFLDFQPPKDELAAFARRDSIQHPFLEALTNWGSNLVLYFFGGKMGQESLLLSKDRETVKEIDIKKTDQVIPFLLAGLNKFRDKYKNLLLADMRQIGYDLENIETSILRNIILESNIPVDLLVSQPIGISVKEEDLVGLTDQPQMSQGMFRSLSLLIQLNYLFLQNQPGTILIDDIGEGLDFERSSSLIKVLIRKASDFNSQLIMTTNDRFVMNSVPIEYWSIIDREGSTCRYYNYRNSKDIFDEYELTGLNNFDLFSSNFYLKNKVNKKDRQ